MFEDQKKLQVRNKPRAKVLQYVHHFKMYISYIIMFSKEITSSLTTLMEVPTVPPLQGHRARQSLTPTMTWSPKVCLSLLTPKLSLVITQQHSSSSATENHHTCFELSAGLSSFALVTLHAL